MFDELKKKIEEMEQKLADVYHGHDGSTRDELKCRCDALQAELDALKTEKQSRVELTSPDGKTKVVLEATNTLSGLWVESDKIRVALFVEDEVAKISTTNKLDTLSHDTQVINLTKAVASPPTL
jgi:hypothetical protein